MRLVAWLYFELIDIWSSVSIPNRLAFSKLDLPRVPFGFLQEHGIQTSATIGKLCNIN